MAEEHVAIPVLSVLVVEAWEALHSAEEAAAPAQVRTAEAPTSAVEDKKTKQFNVKTHIGKNFKGKFCKVKDLFEGPKL